MSTPLRHLIDIQSLSIDTIQSILRRAQQILTETKNDSYPLKNTIICTVFFENSTRTRCSFEIAAKRLGAEVINFDTKNSSTQKGETLLDTFSSLAAMKINAFVVRHSESGIPQFLAEYLPSPISVINAGDGHNAHPTQALLDVLTIQQHKLQLNELSIAIVGDIQHSRVARSQIALFRLLGIKDIRLIAPPGMMPTDLTGPDITHFVDLNKGLADADVIIALRIQKERMEKSNIPNFSDYFQRYGIKQENLSVANKEAIILHPGPINREIDIASAVADGPQAVILQQVTNGVAIRMAILELLLQKGS